MASPKGFTEMELRDGDTGPYLVPKTTTGQRDATKYPAVTTGRMSAAELDKTNPKDILGATKPMLGLNPRVALIWMAKAFEFGAHGRDANGVQVRPVGYGEYNFRETKIRSMVYVHAIERHIADYLDGEDVASDSKVKHLAHIMACCAIALDAEANGMLIDDRPKKGKAGELIEQLTIKKPKESAKTELPGFLEYEKWFQESYDALLKELENVSNYTDQRRSRPARKRARGKSRRQGKADHNGRRRKARQ